MARRVTSPLHRALESFGRRAKCLSVARLEHYPELLVQLFGEEVVSDPFSRREAAERVEAALVAIIAGIRDQTDRRIAEAVLAAKPEFHDLTVTERQEYVEGEDQPLFTRELFKTQRRRVVGDVAVALELAIRSPNGSHGTPILSDRARSAARQLYRYAQKIAPYLDAFDFCDQLGRLAGGEVTLIPQGPDDVDEDLIDPMLWSYTQCQRYLADMTRDLTGSDYLRENLSTEWWDGRLYVPFSVSEVDQLLKLMSKDAYASPQSLVWVMERDVEGDRLRQKWYGFMRAATEFDRDGSEVLFSTEPKRRRNLSSRLVTLCGSLAPLFPADTLSAEVTQDRFDVAVENIYKAGLFEFYLSALNERNESHKEGLNEFDEGEIGEFGAVMRHTDSAIYDLVQRALKDRPTRYKGEEGQPTMWVWDSEDDGWYIPEW